MADKYYERVKLRLWWKRKYVGFFNGVLASAVLCFLSCLTLSLHYNRLYEETSLYYSYGGMASIIVAIVVVAVTAINLFKRTPLPDSQAVGQMIRSSKKIFLTGNITILKIKAVLLKAAPGNGAVTPRRKSLLRKRSSLKS